MNSEDCIFCRIVEKKEASIIYEDDYVMAFMDKFPVEFGHTLIIPKKHYENIFEIDKSSYHRVQELARLLSNIIVRAFEADGLNIGQNNGECANQKVMHYHLHLIPRHCGDRIGWERKWATEDDLKMHCDMIKKSVSERKLRENMDIL